jgi:hypothetical protein
MTRCSSNLPLAARVDVHTAWKFCTWQSWCVRMHAARSDAYEEDALDEN